MNAVSASANVVAMSAGGGPAIIDPAEKTWMGRGAVLGLATGIITGGGIIASDVLEGAQLARRGIQGAGHGVGSVLGTLGLAIGIGLAVGTVGGYLVGHVEDEGWTLPGT